MRLVPRWRQRRDVRARLKPVADLANTDAFCLERRLVSGALCRLKSRHESVCAPFFSLGFCLCGAKRRRRRACDVLGAPKYGASFSHFDYADPPAQGRRVAFGGVVGTFDSLNPFIVRGTAPVGPAFGFDRPGAVYQSLMARSWTNLFALPFDRGQGRDDG